VEFRDYSCCCYFVSSRIRNPMVKKSLRQFTLMATATVTLLLGTNLKTVAVVPCGAKRWKKTGLKYELTS
ncbi:hypothetical protein, partial [Klebsiella pneumoniae]|uniref:hypothetical protein n=1 Tax=Klebsiella pneumoniae TaxID=573 RepID=UPI00197B293B